MSIVIDDKTYLDEQEVNVMFNSLSSSTAVASPRPKNGELHVDELGFIVGDITQPNDTVMDELLQQSYEEDKAIVFGSGDYYFNDFVNFNKYHSQGLEGITILGNGVGLTRLSSLADTDAAFELSSSGGKKPSKGVPSIQAYGSLKEFGMHSVNSGGIVFRLGKHDFSDQINEFECNVLYSHAVGGQGSIGAQFNAVYGSDININGVLRSDFDGNAPSVLENGTVSLDIRRTAFTRFKHAIGGAEIGMRFAEITGNAFDAGFCYANTFEGTNEIVDTCVLLDNPLARSNQWNASTYGYTKEGFKDLQGFNNLVISANENAIATPNGKPKFIRRDDAGTSGGLSLLKQGKFLGGRNTSQTINASSDQTVVIKEGVTNVMLTHQQPITGVKFVFEEIHPEAVIKFFSWKPITNINWLNATMYVPVAGVSEGNFKDIALNGSEMIDTVFYIRSNDKFVMFPRYYK